MRIARLLDLSNDKHVMQQDLRLEHERFELLSRATNDAVWDWDLVNNLIYWNENVETLFGYALESVSLSPEWWYGRVHPEIANAWLAVFTKRLMTELLSWSDEYRFRRIDGSYAYIFDRGYLATDPGTHKPVRMIGTMQDTSAKEEARLLLQSAHDELERKVTKRTEELSKTNTILNAVIEGTSDIVYVKDLQGRYLLMNIAGEHFIGRPRSEIIGVTDAELFDQTTAKRLMSIDQSVIKMERSTVTKGLQLEKRANGRFYR